MLDVGWCFDLNDHQSKKFLRRSEGRAAESFLALGPEREGLSPLQGTHRFDARRHHRDVIARRLRGPFRFRSGELRPFFHPNSLIMAQILAGKDQWYVVHVLSGQENKVRENILKRIKTEEMGDLVYEVLVPTERVSEIKKGKKSETTRKFFPGYLIVNMHLLDENNQLVGRTWYFIRDTPGVIGFAGTKDKPIPMRQSEVDSMLAQMKEREEKVKPKVSFEVGESVKVADGPFQNQTGIVEEIDPERGKLRVSVTIFGRATPVELEYWQVERG